MGINVDSLVINRALSGSMIDRSSGEAIYSLNQITEPSLECSGETVYAKDAVGVNVAAFDRSKEASLSGANAFVNLGLAAAQWGSDKKVASDSEQIVVPVREVLTVTGGIANLSNAPVEAEYLAVNVLTRDGGLAPNGTLTKGLSAAGSEFTLTGTKMTFDDSAVPDGTQILVLYKKSSPSAIQIENRADCFAKGGEFWLEVMFADICDTSTEYHGFLVFPNAKMSNETSIDFNHEATHGFTVEAMQDYCDPEKKLFYMVVSE